MKTDEATGGGTINGHLARFGLPPPHRHGMGSGFTSTPTSVEGNPQILELGTTFSVEPGIYLPGRSEVRIEDIVVVPEDGIL